MVGTNGFFAEVAELVLARARRGDPEAVAKLYETFAGAVYTLGCRLTGSTEGGEEILQETFLEVVRSLRSFRREAPFGAWLRRITVSKVLMRRRRSKVREVEVGVGPEVIQLRSSAATDLTWQARTDLERALVRLPEVTRMVVWLHDVEGMTHREIAQLFGRSTSFSKSQLSRGHTLLRTWLDGEGREVDASINGRVVGVSGR